MADAVDPKVVALGAAAQVAIAVPPALLVRTLRQDDVYAESNLWLVAAFIALIVAPAVAGVLVGRRRPDTPMLHAATGSAVGWLVVAFFAIIRAMAADDDVPPLVASLLTIAPIQVGVGALGAFFARPRSRPEGADPVSAASQQGDGRGTT